MEAHKGKLKKVDLQGLSVEGWCEKYCADNNLEKNQYHNSYQEIVADKEYNNLFFCKSCIYESIEHGDLDDEEICEVTKNEDGTISYIARFYNGATCLSECLVSEINYLGE